MGVVEKEHVKGWGIGEGSTVKANNWKPWLSLLICLFIPFPSWLGYIDTLGSVASRGKQGAARGSTAVRTAVCLVFKEVGGWGEGCIDDVEKREPEGLQWWAGYFEKRSKFKEDNGS